MSLPSIDKIATALGGEVSAGQVFAPGPGHSPADRSLSVKPHPDTPGLFLVHLLSRRAMRTAIDERVRHVEEHL
jgi:hypothetical protein